MGNWLDPLGAGPLNANMCGRYKLTTPTGVIVENFQIRQGRPNLAARYNIAPTQTAPVVRSTPSGRQLALLRWGLIPSWAKDTKIAFSTINARAETVHEKPAFRDAFQQRRCLVVADGYYEWKTDGRGKQPYVFTLKDERPMAFAGLWEQWEKGPETIESFTIVVTQGNELALPIHDRMPVILAPDSYDMWLEGTPDEAVTLLRPADPALMELRPVSRALGNVRNEGPALLQAEGPATGDLFDL